MLPAVAVAVAVAVVVVVAVAVALPAAPALRHRLSRSALRRAAGWYRRRLELLGSEVRLSQERRLRRLLPAGTERGEKGGGAAGMGGGGGRGVPGVAPLSPRLSRQARRLSGSVTPWDRAAPKGRRGGRSPRCAPGLCSAAAGAPTPLCRYGGGGGRRGREGTTGTPPHLRPGLPH